MQLRNTKLITDIDRLKSIVQNEQKNNKRVVFTNGCFDIIHPGHIFILQQAKSKGDILVVGLNSDQSISNFKSKSRPICSEDDRAYVLSGLACVDYIFIFDEMTPENLIIQILPDILVKGKDYTLNQIAGSEYMLEKNKKVELVDIIDKKSTSNIIKKIKNLNS